MSEDHEKKKLDILCFGAHPDDVEIGMAGTIRKHVDEGYKIGICDLTMAELSSNGTVTSRQEEAEAAGKLLGIDVRLNLGFPDRGLEHNRDVIGSIVQTIREYQPEVIFTPYEDDRHPDHGIVTRLVEEAAFTANIRKYQWSTEDQEPHKVNQIYYYIINGIAKPNILVDISPYMEIKKEALRKYKSQFFNSANSVETRLNSGFLEVIEGRERYFGKIAEVTYAEGFMLKEPLLISNLTSNTKG